MASTCSPYVTLSKVTPVIVRNRASGEGIVIDVEKHRTALVLSAGGMFGSYQAGAWLHLSRVIRPDIVVGASIGSLNGWMIAGGVDPDDLARRWLEFDSAGILRRRDVEAWIRRTHTEFQPAVDYGLVATALPSLRPRLFRTPDVTWQHLASSCAIPVVLKQYWVDGALHCDGGLMIPCPVWAAVQMGATRIVAVDLLPVRPPALRAIARAAQRISRFECSVPPDVELVKVSPSGRLGTIRESIEWTRANSERWLNMGLEDARRTFPLPVGSIQS